MDLEIYNEIKALGQRLEERLDVIEQKVNSLLNENQTSIMDSSARRWTEKKMIEKALKEYE